ncbi:MAG: hypothetical protein Kow0099_35180 [Candidatus Abyssubacteria bacterium]
MTVCHAKRLLWTGAVTQRGTPVTQSELMMETDAPDQDNCDNRAEFE